MKRVISGFLLVVLLASMLTLVSHIQPVNAGTITVPTDFPTIQEAINSAHEGDTIFVRSGVYYENLEVNKTVSLLGEHMATTILDGNETGDCVRVTAGGVGISRFTVRNGGGVYPSVRLCTSYNSILNCNLSDSWCGVQMEHYSSYNMIANNTITDNLNGIAGELLHYNQIVSNCIRDNLMGIWLGPYSQNNVVSFNDMSDHWSEGIMMMQSSGNMFEGNNITGNNQGGFSAAITIGFQEGFSSGNKFFHNNIVNKGQQVSLQAEDPTVWDNAYPSGGNFWGDYNGSDIYSGPYQNETGSDRIGDTSYNISANKMDAYPLVFPYGYVPSPDFDEDGAITIFDVVKIARAYGSVPGVTKWNPYVDLNQDSQIDILDLVAIAISFGEQWPPP